jgi:uncharacterized protein YdaU (DUF1376 family)
MHYYKFEISVWNLHTAHLSLVEEAVYRRLIDHYYDTEQPIALDYKGMIRRLRLDGYEDEVVTILNEFFTQGDNGWSNKHCDLKIKAYKNQKKVNKNNGKSGGRPKKREITESVSDGLPFVTLTTNNKQETKNNVVGTRGTRLPTDWEISDEQKQFCLKERPDLDPMKVAESFKDYWISAAGAKGVKKDWDATWRNWVRAEKKQFVAKQSNDWWTNDARIK